MHTPVRLQEASVMKSKFIATWMLLPVTVRKTIVFVIGSTFILTGMLLVVLPGPFTLPLVIFGLIVLAIEFAWAEILLEKVKAQAMFHAGNPSTGITCFVTIASHYWPSCAIARNRQLCLTTTAMVNHDQICSAMIRHVQPWSDMASHDQPWSA